MFLHNYPWFILTALVGGWLFILTSHGRIIKIPILLKWQLRKWKIIRKKVGSAYICLKYLSLTWNFSFKLTFYKCFCYWKLIYSIELGNKQNLQYRKLFSRPHSIQMENLDIFRRRLLISDPYVIIEGENCQELRRGNIRVKK